MKEFRLVIYMNAPGSRRFYGGRGAASPLAYYCHLRNKKRKNPKVFLGGSIRLIGLGKYHSCIQSALEAASEPLTLPLTVCYDRDEQIVISKTAFIYQNDDPLLSASQSGIYWKAQIKEIRLRGSFSKKEQERFTLGAVKIGLEEYKGQVDETRGNEWVVLASRLDKLPEPLDKHNSAQLKVYGGSHRERSFWGDNGKPTISRCNAFVHMTSRQWQRYDKAPPEVNIRKLIDSQIKHNHINESLVHEMLKIMFARKGWWVNYELPTGGKDGGRIDFLIKQGPDDDWQLIEVKLHDNPDAVAQLRGYKKAIEHAVRKLRKKSCWESHFWLLWNGSGRCKNIKGVILCEFPGEASKEDAAKAGYDFWTYRYNVKNKQLGIEVCDAKNKKIL